jgi:hypothetical protein
VLVSLKINEEQLEMKLETIHQFIEIKQPKSAVHQKLNICIMKEKCLISINSLLLLRERS